MSVIDSKKGYIIPNFVLNEEDISTILPKDTQILIDDLLMPSDPLLEIWDWQEKPILDINKILENEPTAAAETSRQGFSQPKMIEHHYPLHKAAQADDLDTIDALIKAGHDVNQEDHRSSRPFHMAAFYGNTRALSLLIKHGSDLSDKALGGYTALDLAVRNHHFTAARILTATGAFNPSEDNPEALSPLKITYDALEKAMEDMPQSVININNMISTLKEMIAHTDRCYILQDNSLMPLVMKVRVLASFATTQEIQDNLNDLAHTLESKDPSYASYIASLDLLHHFPTGKVYEFNISENEVIQLEPIGHFVQYTTPLANRSISAYIQTLSIENSTQDERDVFHTINEIYRDAVDFKNNALLPNIIQEALDLYNHGETILLPSGWEGHFVNVILNKELGLYITANSGDRYVGENPHTDITQGDPPGILFYRIEDPQAIDFNFIQNTLTNYDKAGFIYAAQHHYGLTERVYEIQLKDQEFNNCAWESHRDAVEGLIFLELMRMHMSPDDAQRKAKEYFSKWDEFHGNYVIEQYAQKGYGLSIDSVIDVFKSHIEKSNGSHGQQFLKLLESDYYHADFKTWLTQHHEDTQFHDFIESLQSTFHVNVTDLIQQHILENPVEQHTETIATEQHFVNPVNEIIPVHTEIV